MRNFKFRKMFRSAVMLIALVVCCSSCEKEDEVAADYVGTWIDVIEIPVATGFITMREVMTFSENTVVDVMQTGGYNDKWIDISNLKGSISVSGNLMTVTISEVGISSIDPITRMPTGTIISYKETGPEFESILSKAEQPKVFESEYSVSGDKLTLKTDNNDDGDYEDANETTVYARQ